MARERSAWNTTLAVGAVVITTSHSFHVAVGRDADGVANTQRRRIFPTIFVFIHKASPRASCTSRAASHVLHLRAAACAAAHP